MFPKSSPKYMENFVAKLSSKIDFETFELGEAIKASEKEKCSETGAVCTIPEISTFVFTKGGQNRIFGAKKNTSVQMKL